jgi:hypothetical protein
MNEHDLTAAHVALAEGLVKLFQKEAAPQPIDVYPGRFEIEEAPGARFRS